MPLSEDDMQQLAVANSLTLPHIQEELCGGAGRKEWDLYFSGLILHTPIMPAPRMMANCVKSIRTSTRLTVGQEHILTKPGVMKYPPLPVSFIYT